MDSLANLIWHNGRFLGIEWHFWKVVGWIGLFLFSTRFYIQWWATEKHKRGVVPAAFWWISMAGSGCLLAYGVYQRDSVIILSYLFTWIPYARNLVIGYRVNKSMLDCPKCQAQCHGGTHYCPQCGAPLVAGISSAAS